MLPLNPTSRSSFTLANSWGSWVHKVLNYPGKNLHTPLPSQGLPRVGNAWSLDTGTGRDWKKGSLGIRSDQRKVFYLSGCRWIRGSRRDDQGMRIHHNHLTEGWLLRAQCIYLNKSPKEAAKILILDENYFSEEAEILFAIGRYLSFAKEPLRARDYIRRAIKLDNRYRKKLLEDKALDQVWDSFAWLYDYVDLSTVWWEWSFFLMVKEIWRTLNPGNIKNSYIDSKGCCLNEHRLFLFLENWSLSTDETLRCFLST